MTSGISMLVQPIIIGPLSLNNRMVKSPMWSRTSTIDGAVTQQLLDLYAHAASGGPSMIIVEAIAIGERYAWREPQLQINDRKFMSGLRRLVETIHLHGIPCEFQLNCAGAFGRDPVSPSGVASYWLGRMAFVQPRTANLPEVDEIRNLFIEGAARAQEIGCDGVVLHGASSNLLQQWVSPHTNKRTDRYGGSFENRIQLPLEIVRGIRETCGSSFLIGYSMVMDELLPYGITADEAVAFARALETSGLNHIDLNIGTFETSSLEKGVGRSNRQPKGTFDRTAIFKESVNMHVFARCNGEHDPIKWEEALQKRQCDAIQIGRPLLADPELPNKVKDGRLDDIRLCIRCGQCYETGTIKAFQHACSVNAALCKERDYTISRIDGAAKRVLVVGGGPAGLEAARVAALRGHRVVLMEKEAKLGGNARIGSLAIGKDEIQHYFIDWLERQCRKLGVELELNKEASIDIVEKMNPDVVIVATGSSPFMPDIPGIDKPHVVFAEDVLTGNADVGKRVLVVGGGLVGVETADFIAERKLAEDVTVIEMGAVAATDMPGIARTYMLQVLLPRWGVRVITNIRLLEITNYGAVAVDKDLSVRKFEVDTIVNALGYVPNTSLADALHRVVGDFYKIGDCVKPRNILSAVHEAAFVARQI